MIKLALMSAVLLCSCLTLAQTDVQLSEIETNPIPTMINFDGNQVQQEQQTQVQGYYDLDGTFVPTQNEGEIKQLDSTNNQSVSLFNDPNNFLLSDTQGSSGENQNSAIPVENNTQDLNDQSIPSQNFIDTQSNDADSQNVSNEISNVEQNLQSQDNQQVEQKTESLQEQSSNCIILYSQCHYKGESLQLCQSLKDIDNFDHEIRSIYVPEGYSVRLYNQEGFAGERTVIKHSEECLIKPLSLTQLFGKQTGKFMILAQNMNLRGQ